MDDRWRELAHILVHHSVTVQPGDRVMIAMGEIETFPLVHAVYEAAIQAGAYPQVQFLSESLRHLVMRHGDTAQTEWVPEMEAHGMEWADVYLGLRGAFPLAIHGGIPDDVLAANQRAMGRISTLRWQKTRWCLVRVPNAVLAEQAGLELDALFEMFFAACFLDWVEEGARWRALASGLEGGGQVHVLGEGTDLHFSVEGRRWLVLDGRINMPDGEIFTAPVNPSLNGHITFDLPGVLGGRLVHNIRLTWRDGHLVDAGAATNEAYLHRILATDEGSSRLGEFGIGLNAQIRHFCSDILLDEKMGGTIHLALGRAYPECGGRNESAIHWDLVKDLRRQGSVTLDGVTILKGGQLCL